MIRSILQHDNYVIVVEHDLSILDYLSDFVCCLYGTPGAYGVVTMPFSVREGINIFLAGYVPTENVRFRDFELTFKVKGEGAEEEESKKKPGDDKQAKKIVEFTYPTMVKTLGPFKLTVNGGRFAPSECLVMLGQNGTGKTTMIKMLAGLLQPDGGDEDLTKLNISYKPQTIAPKFDGTV
jgi:ATP-binding cassette subfamily E protein 1